MVELATLSIGDPAELWESLGFTVESDTCHISGVAHVLGGSGEGLLDWGLRGTDVTEIDGLRVGMPAAPAQPTPEHANSVIGFDHLVMTSSNMARTIAGFEEAGIECRRIRDAGRGIQQAFFRLGEVILELAGPAEGTGDGPPSLFGLAYTVSDLDATAHCLGDKLRPAKSAVQSGRQISTLDWGAGSSVAIAFMSPDPRNS